MPQYWLSQIMRSPSSCARMPPPKGLVVFYGKNHAISFASSTLNVPEVNYSVTHQEALAVGWALNKFRDMILGYPITVYTEHATVTNLFKGRNVSGRLAP